MSSEMIGIIEKIQETLPVGKEFTFVLYFLPLIGLVYKPLKDFWHDVKRGRIKKLEETLNSPYLDADTKKFIEANLSEEYFKLGTGMALSYGFRIKLMQLYHKDNSPIAFMHYKRVMDYMKYQNGEIEQVKIPRVIEVMGYIMVVLGCSLFLNTLVLFCKLLNLNWMTVNSGQDWLMILGLYLLCTFFFIVSLFLIVKPYAIYCSAKYINQQIGVPYDCWYYTSVSKKKRWRYYLALVIIILLYWFVFR